MPTYIDQLYGTYYTSNELYHHGILGQKWGVRRFQNKDGSLTAAGKKRYSNLSNKKEHFHLTDRQKTALKIGAGYVATMLYVYGIYKLAPIAIKSIQSKQMRDSIDQIIENSGPIIVDKFGNVIDDFDI